MALKDLVYEHGKVAEEMIEKIISGLANYELNPNAIVFTSKGTSLNNVEKVLIYLTATLGWQYVANDDYRPDTKPADLETALGIPGGTLRPTLKKMKDSHLLTVVNGHYSIHPSKLGAVAQAIAGEKSVHTPRNSAKTPKAKSRNEKGTPRPEGDPDKTKKKSGVPIRSSLNQLIAEGFFVEHRTLRQISNRLDELAIITKVTSLSGPIADFVRDKKLQRKKIEHKGKQIWAYKAAKKISS